MNPRDILDKAVFTAICLFIGGAIVGYAVNIVKLAHMDWNAALSILGVLRMAGILFPPLGAIMGIV